MGLIDWQLIAIDRTKIRVQNSKHNCITQTGLDEKIECLKDQINAYFMAKQKEVTAIEQFKEKFIYDS